MMPQTFTHSWDLVTALFFLLDPCPRNSLPSRSLLHRSHILLVVHGNACGYLLLINLKIMMVTMMHLVTVIIFGCLYECNGSSQIARRVEKTLNGMSTIEKIQQTYAQHNSWKTARPFVSTGLGALKFMSGFDCGKNVSTGIRGCIEARNQAQAMFMNGTSRIPVSMINEGLHGGAPFGTIFPMPINQGYSWNTSLVGQIATAIANEASAIGVDTVFAPVVNMITDPRFGRMQEGFSENPIITTRMGVASVRGLQGEFDKDGYIAADRVVSLGKHFAAYGQPSGGLNGAPAQVTDIDMHDIFLRPWKAMARAGMGALMPAHNTVRNVPCHANEWLLNTTMRNTFRFQGIMLSDCDDVGVLADYRFAANQSHAAALGLRAGVDWDLQCGTNSSKWAYNALNESLHDGLIDDVDLNRTVRRVLTHKFRARLFDNRSYVDPDIASQVLDRPAHRQLAREAAEQSIVMLLNRDNALPLRLNEITSVALIGPTASRAGCGNCDESETSIIGSYYLRGAHVVTMDEALATKMPSVNVRYSAGTDASGPTTSSVNETLLSEAVDIASHSDVSILVLGDLDPKSCAEWGDRDDLDLSGGQLTLLDAVASVAKKTIVILIHGRPQTFGKGNAVLNKVDAMFAAGRPGEEFGSAMVRLLMGDVNPSAKLAQSWPRTVGHVGGTPFLQRVRGKWIANARGDDVNGRRYDDYVASNFQSTPLFYFGFGLSYTTYSYHAVSVSTNTRSGGWDVDVILSNDGNVDGTEIVQVYVQDPSGVLPYVPFWSRLVGFARCPIAAGAQMAKCRVSIEEEDLAVYDPIQGLYRVFPGKYVVSAGGSSNANQVSIEVLV